MLARFARYLATGLALLIGAAGVLAILWAWHLPPFTTAVRLTEDAYVRGRVVTLAPELAGRIAAVAVQDFQAVKAGDLIVKIDDAIVRQRLAQAQASLAGEKAALSGLAQDVLTADANIRSAEAGLASAEAQLAVAEANLKRADELRRRGVTTEREAEEAQLARDQARAARDQAAAETVTAKEARAAINARRQALQASAASAEAAVELARIDLAHTAIVASTDGRLGEVSARVGQYVTAGTRLVGLVAADTWIVANFKETELAGMQIGQPVMLTVDALGGAALSGRIVGFAPATGSEFSLLPPSNATGNFIKIAQRLPVRIAVDPGQPLAERLAPGLSVVARVDTSAAPVAAPVTADAGG